MKRIGIRELRQHASVWLHRVEAGESFEVTDHGRPIALLVPARSDGVIAKLSTAGRLSSGNGSVLDLGEPLPPQPGKVLPSDALERARAHER